MTKVILGLPRIPRPDHAADALAVAITHSHQCAMVVAGGASRARSTP